MSLEKTFLPRELVPGICVYVTDASTLWALCNTAQWVADMILEPHRLLPCITQQTAPVLGPNAGGWFDLTDTERKKLLIKQAVWEQGESWMKFAPKLREAGPSMPDTKSRLLLWSDGAQVNLWDVFNDTCLLSTTLRNTRRELGDEVPWGEIRDLKIEGDTVFVLMTSASGSERYIKVECLQVGGKDPQHRTVRMGRRRRNDLLSAWLCGTQLHVLDERISMDCGVTYVRRRLEHWDLTPRGDSAQVLLRRIDPIAWVSPLGAWYLFVSTEPIFAGVRGALLLDPPNRNGDDRAEGECEDYPCSASAPGSASTLGPTPPCYLHLFDSERDRGVRWQLEQDQDFHLTLSSKRSIGYDHHQKAKELWIYDYGGIACHVHRGEEVFTSIVDSM